MPHLRLFILSLVLAQCLSAAQICPAGTFIQGSRCIACPPGTYQNATSSTSCIPCPPGHFNPFRGAQYVDLCEPCPASTFRALAGGDSISSCTKCSLNTNAPPGSSRCISCSPGTIVSSCPLRLDPEGRRAHGLGLCVDCFGGCKAFPQELKCRTCPGNTFAPKSNALVCKPCPMDMISDFGASRCRFRTVRERHQCPAGFQIPRGDVKRCIPCPKGTARRSYQGECRTCRKGENTNIRGAEACTADNTPCAINFFRNRFGACQKCRKNERFDEKRLVCVPCRIGEFSEGGLQKQCNMCPRNAHTITPSFNGFGCACNAGFFLNEKFECIACPAGRFMDEKISAFPRFCAKCSPGTFAPKKGMNRCLPCPKGTIQPEKGQTKCFPCPAGTKPDKETSTQCVDVRTNCPKGTNRVQENGSVFFSCQLPASAACPSGSFKVVHDSANDSKYATCEKCFKFSRYDPARNSCAFCGPKMFSRGGTDTKCRRCPKNQNYDDDFTGCNCNDGMFNNFGQCVDCPPGSISNRRGACVKCPPGRYSDDPQGILCKECLSGTFSSKAGSTRCEKCPSGTTTFNTGSASCVRKGSLK